MSTITSLNMSFNKGNVNELSPSTLAFVGDAVYGLMARSFIASVNRPSGELHALSVKYVCAGAQAKGAKAILGNLSESEASVFRRGRNFHTKNTPKSATGGEYHLATALECLFGYLYLSDNTVRAEELFSLIIKALDNE